MGKFLGLPVLASENGQGVDRLVIYIHWLMIVLFVGWLCYFVYALFRFHRKRNPKGDYQGVKNHASNYIEVTVAGIESALLIFVAVPLWARHADQFPKESESTVIQVVAQQFAWNVRYPGKDGEFGAVRSVAGEILVGKTELSYTYTQPVREGRPYNMYHGTLEARPLTATTSKLVYTLFYDNSMLADDAARERDKAQRTTRFTQLLANMKVLAEGGTLPPPAARGGAPNKQ